MFDGKINIISGDMDFLAGGGEMGMLMRTLDWSKTPVGPIGTWPQSLRTAVSICVGSRHPIEIWWGPDYVRFYNDAYRPVLGATKHPQFLGRPGRECWAEIWDEIGPMLDSVSETGVATWSEDYPLMMTRNGYLEETYFTFSYSPLRDETGGIGGVFCACSETTKQVLSARRTRTLRDLSIEASSAEDAVAMAAAVLANNPLDIPFALIYLTDGTHAHLSGSVALDAGAAASPQSISLIEGTSAVWPLAEVARSGEAQTITGLLDRVGTLPCLSWPEPPHTAMALPIGRTSQGSSMGFLVAGVSPRRALDDDYRGFLELLAQHIGVVVGNARALEEQKQRIEKLAELDRAKTAFFSNISHEFRTPLTLMIGPLQDALQRTDGLDDEQRERIDIAYRNSLRLLKLANTLLDFSRLEAGRVRTAFAPTDLSAVTADLASTFRSITERAGLRFTVDCQPLSQPVYLDAEMWEKIVLNLLSNAFKFTFAGEIAVRLTETDEHAVLTVADTGTGIPEYELPSLFDRFHRVEGAQGRTYEGTGIGLALVQELVQLHGGTVRVESTLGQGTTFTVRLPLGTPPLPVDRAAVQDPSAERETRLMMYTEEAQRWLTGPLDDATADLGALRTGAGARPKILLADDNSDMRGYIARILAPHYDVIVAPDGVEALAAVHRYAPDVVLTDVMMPRMDGLALLKALREDPGTRMLPIILLSARSAEDAQIHGLEAGADDYLVKPFSARELLARVGAHVSLAAARADARRALEMAYAHQREIAETLQRALVTIPASDAFPGIHIGCSYEAALADADVGGDFLDAFLLQDEKVALVVGDVSGKGLAAATRTAEVKYSLRAFLREHASPELALARVNTVLCEGQILSRQDPHEGFVCLALAVIDTLSGELHLALASAEPPVIVRASGEAEEVTLRGTPLGMVAKASYDSQRFILDPGDLLAMVTDGITEARRGGEFFGSEGLRSALIEERILASTNEITKRVIDRSKAFAGGALRDDVCMLVARRY